MGNKAVQPLAETGGVLQEILEESANFACKASKA
jgi:hypothetical protein